MSDIPWPSVSIHRTPQFWPRHDGNRTDADVTPKNVYANVMRCNARQGRQRDRVLGTVIHQRRLTPSCGGQAPTAERTVGPARMIAESLTPKPGIREQNLPKAASCNATNDMHPQRDNGRADVVRAGDLQRRETRKLLRRRRPAQGQSGLLARPAPRWT